MLERVDGLPLRVVTAMLDVACDHAERQAAVTDDASWGAESARLRAIAEALGRLEGVERARIDTQVPTATGRFVDLEVRLQPARPSSELEDVVIWVEVKYGAAIHGDQLEAYLRDIRTRPARHHVVVLLAPRGDSFVDRPREVPLVEWEAVGRAVTRVSLARALPDNEGWILNEYLSYLEEEGLMDPDALTAVHALSLMSSGEAEDALAGVCEHADAAVSVEWGKPTDYGKPARSRSDEAAFGVGYWASFDARPAAETWREGWFEWGNDDPENWQYIDADEIRGSNVFYAGAGFKAKTNPYVVEENEAWIASLLSAGFVWCWFGDFYRLVRVKYPDELLSETTLEGQGLLLAGWIAETFRLLEASPPPH